MGKRKEILKSCGNCHICGKEHMSNEGGWVINAEKLNFCHSLDYSCYEIYFNNVRTAEKQRLSSIQKMISVCQCTLST